MSKTLRVVVSCLLGLTISVGTASADVFIVETWGELTAPVGGVFEGSAPGDQLRFTYVIDTSSAQVIDEHYWRYEVSGGELELNGTVVPLKEGFTGRFDPYNDYWVVDGFMSSAPYEGASIKWDLDGIVSSWFPSPNMEDWSDGYWDLEAGDLEYHSLQYASDIGGAPVWFPTAIGITRESVVCEADFNLDGNVGFVDLTALLGIWGPVPADFPMDLNGDGNVGFVDLTQLLGAWGPC